MRGMALSSTGAAGYQVAKDALGGVLSSEHLTLGKRKWKLRRGKEDHEGGPLLASSNACSDLLEKTLMLRRSLVPVQKAGSGARSNALCDTRCVPRQITPMAMPHDLREA